MVMEERSGMGNLKQQIIHAAVNPENHLLLQSNRFKLTRDIWKVKIQVK
jgi:hypothetical protein